jgi:hypothetical protein
VAVLPDIQAARSNDMDRLAIAACFGVEMELFAVLAARAGCHFF